MEPQNNTQRHTEPGTSRDAMSVPTPAPRNGLFQVLYDNLPVAPSMMLPSGHRSRGWTLRGTRLSPTTARFDWIHGVDGTEAYMGSPTEREALRNDVLAAATRVAVAHGFNVKPNGIGLDMTPPRQQ